MSTKFEKSVKIIHTKRECMVDSRCTVIVIFYYLKDSLMIVQTLHCFGTKSIDRDTRIPNTLCTKRLKDEEHNSRGSFQCCKIKKNNNKKYATKYTLSI